MVPWETHCLISCGEFPFMARRMRRWHGGFDVELVLDHLCGGCIGEERAGGMFSCFNVAEGNALVSKLCEVGLVVGVGCVGYKKSI